MKKKKKSKKKLKDGCAFVLKGTVFFSEVKNGKETLTEIPGMTVLQVLNAALEDGLRRFEEQHNVKA